MDWQYFDFNTLKPNGKLFALKKPKDKSIVTIKRWPIFANPDRVYKFELPS